MAFFNFLKNHERLAEDEAAALEKARSMHRPLSDAYMLKEELRSIYATARTASAARHLFERWCRLADGTGLPEMRSMAKQVRGHIEGILGYWTFAGASNASTEGFNNKIRWLISQAYGFHDYEYFRLKVFDLPSTNIKKCL